MMQSISRCSTACVKYLSYAFWHRLYCTYMCFWPPQYAKKMCFASCCHCKQSKYSTSSMSGMRHGIADKQLTELKWPHWHCMLLLCLCVIRLFVCHHCSCMPLCGCVSLLWAGCFYCVSHVMYVWWTVDTAVLVVLNLLLNAKFCRKLMAENAYLDCAKRGACLRLNWEDCNKEHPGVNVGYEDEDILQVWWTVDTAVLAESDIYGISQHILRCQSTPSFRRKQLHSFLVTGKRCLMTWPKLVWRLVPFAWAILMTYLQMLLSF